MHDVKDCLERPRKIGAKFSGKFANDEIVKGPARKDDFDSKRDRWDGYDNSMYSKVIEEHQALEEARRRIREEEIDKSTDIKTVERVAKAGKGKKKAGKDAGGDDDDADFGSSDESDDEDELKYAEGADVVGQKVDTKTRITVRNLRIREDTAKYLLNLDAESAYYDPKTRSMRENPNPEKRPEDVGIQTFLAHC
jgi:pre-mRNA-processing factor SLU7